MTNEIKEILDIFYNEYPKEEKILEKYITNLQEIEKEHQKINGELRQEITNLQKENKVVDKIKKLRNANTHIENIYYAEGVLLNEPYYDIEGVYNDELLNILRGDE